MSAAPGGELAVHLQRLAEEVNNIKVTQTQQNAEIVQQGVDLNSLRLNIPEVGKQAVDQVNQATAVSIAELKSEVGTFLNTSQTAIDSSLQQIANAVLQHEQGIKHIEQEAGVEFVKHREEFVKQSSTISTHKQQLLQQ